MKRTKARALKKAGWRVGSAREFLELSADESALIEMRLSLGRDMRDRRIERGLSQAALAQKLGSSQSRVAKMESADPTVSLDLLIRSLLALGAGAKDIARVLGNI